MTYREALAYLESLQPHVIRPGLDRVRVLLARLGDPHQAFPSVLIGGTNGKGSVTAFLASILRAAGLAPGVYTSPHLVRFEERIVVGEEPIGEQELAELTAEVRAAIVATAHDGDDLPTYFEATTAMAFLHFRRRRVPIALLEVGMGGRYDATNVVTPLACAITPIALDHMQWLGGTLAEIAYQKTGILRPGVPAVLGRQPPEAMQVVRDEAARLGTRLVFAGDCDARPAVTAAASLGASAATAALRPDPASIHHTDPPVVSLVTPRRRYDRLALSLRGDHQVDNAAVAVLLAEALATASFPAVDAAAIARGLATVRWPGRIEIVPGRPDLLLDGAHNPAACQTLANYLSGHQIGRPIALLFSAMKDKPSGEMLDLLCPLARDAIVTQLSLDRGQQLDTLLSLAQARHGRVAALHAIPDALAAARAAAGSNGLCVVSGSLYLVGEVKALLRGRSPPEKRPDADTHTPL
jgi:dihydrofolate synthase / folylpolyglutamate synthase